MINVREFRKKLRIFEQFLNNQFQERCCGISIAQCHCLMAVEDLGKTTTGELANYRNLDKSTLSRTVDKLVLLGYVNRENNPEDRRINQIFLTQSGIKQIKEMHAVNDEYFTKILDQIPEEDQKNVINSFGLFTDAIRHINELNENSANCCEDN